MTTDNPHAFDSLRAELTAAREQAERIRQQISLYEMSRSDIDGLDPESTLVAIANILETGHPGGAEAAVLEGEA